uniref:E3 ubiquitin protein ligase-1 n=1 Tax=Schmidtea mediterranea TaxID=79327 RepID=I1ZI76_SCHMD|nr:E3 ubiquitin protein ligase-1 [Schmidtea mediterranea]
MAINQNSDFINWENQNLYFLICLLPLFENVKLANFWNNLSSTARVLKSGEKKMCTNHDDESTIATVICYTCQPISNATDPTDLSLSARLIFLCAECDRYLHLSKMTKYHIRDNLNIQPISPKDNLSLCDCIVNSHESCVRLKSSKFIVTVDTSTLKILINLSQNAMNNNNTTTNNNNDITPNNTDIEISKPSDQNERCRFCNETSTNVDNKFACLAQECQIKSSVACSDKIQPCGHWCLGVVLIGKNESKMKKVCPPLCIVPTCSNQSTLSKFGLKQDGDDVCMICFTDTLSEGPIIILENCRHMLHYHCARRQIQAGWPGYRVSFNFRKCPFCKQKIEHPALQDLLEPYDILEKEVKRKALLRLEHEGLIDSPEMKDSDGAIKELPEEFALHKYCYYLCYKCKNSYYGGEARCEPDMLLNTQTNNDRVNNSPVMDPATELCCAACSDVAQAKICPKHSTDFLEYKCRYCCSIAVFFCFGTTHFCQRCHDNLDTVLKAPWLPQCPAGPALQHLSTPECPLHVIHPPTGEEFALGCALCRKLDTF